MLRHLRFTYLIVCLALSSMIWSLSKGSTSIPFDQLLFSDNKLFQTILLQFRLPRMLSAFTVGGLLALSGQLTQLLLQNPLADPYVLGIAGGAALSTLLLMLFGASSAYLLGGAWTGSLFTILLILFLARKHQWQPSYLLLTGIALSCGFSAIISCVLLLSPDKNLHSMLFWLAGDLSYAPVPWIEMLILITAFLFCLYLAPGLDLLTRGEQEARALGLPYRRYRCLLYFISSLLTAAAVTLAGCIGFIGLIIPHFTRQIMGHQQRDCLLLNILLGGTLLTIADTLARTWIAPQQLPVGILMALIGTPVFIYLLYLRPVAVLSAPVIHHDADALPCVKKMSALLQVKNLSIGIGEKPLTAPFSFTLAPGEIWGVLGANGSGKTTLLHTLAGLLAPLSGEVSLNNQTLADYDAKSLAKIIGVLFQTHSSPFSQSVYDYCLAARFPHHANRMRANALDHASVTAALRATDLTLQAARNIHHLSGGEKRRAALASVFTQSPAIYLLDEPTNHLDLPHQVSLLRYLQQLTQNAETAVMMALHDVNHAQRYCTHVILLGDGRAEAGRVEEMLTVGKLSKLYQDAVKRYTDGEVVYWVA